MVAVAWWLVALAVLALPLGHAVRATCTYLSGYHAHLTDSRDPNDVHWRDPAGRPHHGPLRGDYPEDEWDESADYTSPVWVSPEGRAYALGPEAYSPPPVEKAVILGYAGSGAVLLVAGLALRVRYVRRRERAG